MSSSRNRLAIVALAAALATTGCRPSQPAPAVDDGRTALTVPPDAAIAVWEEMRTMLGSVQAIVSALPNGDTAAMRGAALRAGTAEAADTALESILPEGFVTLGMTAHRGFDDLAAIIGAGAGTDTVAAHLGRILTACVSCHSQYRLVVTDGPPPEQ